MILVTILALGLHQEALEFNEQRARTLRTQKNSRLMGQKLMYVEDPKGIYHFNKGAFTHKGQYKTLGSTHIPQPRSLTTNTKRYNIDYKGKACGDLYLGK